MPLRLMFWFRLGPPQACFRFATRPGSLAWQAGYGALERAIADTGAFLTGLDPDERRRVLTGVDQSPRRLIPALGTRLGANDVYGDELPDGTISLVICTSFRFRWWPLGEWVAFDGIHFTPDNPARAFSEEELSEVW